ncbi:MAG TPA: rod shape-determining protein [Bacillota bacterium]|nr:rod shape-determining protein [Bacillota bacterium]
MLQKLINSLRPQSIAINISDGRLWATVAPGNALPHELSLNEVLSPPSPTLDLTQPDPATLRLIFKKVFKTRVKGWLRPQVLISVPPGIAEAAELTILNAARQAGAGQVSLIDEFFAAALGAGVYRQTRESALQKKIFLWVKQDAAYLGFVFAGSALQVRIIPQGYAHLSQEDLRHEFQQLLNQQTPEFPEELKNRPIPKEDLGLIEKAWQAEDDRRVYITAPSPYHGSWGQTLNDYQITYTEAGEEAVDQGLAIFLAQNDQESYDRTRQSMLRMMLIFLIFAILTILLYWTRA